MAFSRTTTGRRAIYVCFGLWLPNNWQPFDGRRLQCLVGVGPNIHHPLRPLPPPLPSPKYKPVDHRCRYNCHYWQYKQKMRKKGKSREWNKKNSSSSSTTDVWHTQGRSTEFHRLSADGWPTYHFFGTASKTVPSVGVTVSYLSILKPARKNTAVPTNTQRKIRHQVRKCSWIGSLYPQFTRTAS